MPWDDLDLAKGLMDSWEDSEVACIDKLKVCGFQNRS